MKKVQGVYHSPDRHWVGDGFPVHQMFSYSGIGQQLNPFILLDYGAPYKFEPADTPRGVGAHPHRGFETVTIVFDGEVTHRDTHGGGGTIGAGDVQWMTAGSGLLHEEFHSPAYTARGGDFHMVQLWVNLPAKHKMTQPRYQAILNNDIPQVALPNNAGSVRVIAGEYAGKHGAASTFTPMNVWDIHLNANADASLQLPQGWASGMVVLSGTLQVNDSTAAQSATLVVFDKAGEHIKLHANTDAHVLMLSGEPIDEPVVGYGPFVMNTHDEINQAVADLRAGKFGQM